MNYQVIARRYRPRRFEEVVGQEAVGETLRAGILQDRIAHAYLFTGPRGVGKTSMARIFAKALNCPQASDRSRPREDWARPCDTCSICEAIHSGQDVDVIEMDGASHRGIEDVRSLVEGVNRPATRSRYKVFIIDEVHMLTREAFNALLKTLEEPPGHVKFVFATTEAHRIPDTVISRCQRFDFHPIREESIVRRLEQILELEGRKADDGLLVKIARCGKGGLRDAQSLLDQLLTFAEGTLCEEDLDKLTGRVPEESLRKLADATLENDTAAVLDQLRACFARGADPALLMEQLIENYRERLHSLVRGEERVATRASEVRPTLDRLLGALQILVDASGRLRTTAFAEVAVELVLLKLARLEDPASVEEAIRLLRGVECREGARGGTASGGSSGAASGPPEATPGSFSAALRASVEDRERREPAAPGSPGASSVPPDAPPPDPPSARGRPSMSGVSSTDTSPARFSTTAPPAPTAVAEAEEPARCDFQRLLSVWEQFRIELEKKHPDVAPYFKDVSPALAEDAGDVVVLRFADDFFLRQMKTKRRMEAFESLLQDVTAAPWRARMELGAASSTSPVSRDERNDSRLADGADKSPRSSGESPVRAPGHQGIASDPLVQKSLDLFHGRLV